MKQIMRQIPLIGSGRASEYKKKGEIEFDVMTRSFRIYENNDYTIPTLMII